MISAGHSSCSREYLGASSIQGPKRSQAKLSFEFSLCSHQFSTRTHPSSPQVSCDLENTCFLVCQLSLAFLANLGESCVWGLPRFRLCPRCLLNQRSPGSRGAVFAPALALLCVGLREGRSLCLLLPALCWDTHAAVDSSHLPRRPGGWPWVSRPPSTNA